MKIHRLEIQAFGQFIDRSFDFCEGLNLVQGDNEAGKSTIHAFIEAMLYGFFDPTKSSRRMVDLHRHYQPIASERYGGRIIFEHTARVFVLTRNLQAKAASVTLFDYTTGEDLTTTLDIHPQTRLPDIAAFIDLPYVLFNNSLSIRQLEMATTSAAFETLMQKMQNIAATKTASLSAEKAIQFLQKQLDEIGSPQAPTKPLAIALNEQKVLQQKRMAILNQLNDIFSHQQALEERSVQINQVKADIRDGHHQRQHIIQYKRQQWIQRVLTVEMAYNEAIQNQQTLEPYAQVRDEDYHAYHTFVLNQYAIKQRYQLDPNAEACDLLNRVTTLDAQAQADAAKLDANIHKHRTWKRWRRVAQWLSILILPLVIVLFASWRCRCLLKAAQPLKATRTSSKLAYEETVASLQQYNAAQNGRNILNQRYGIADLETFEHVRRQHEAYREATFKKARYLEALETLLDGQSLEQLKAEHSDFVTKPHSLDTESLTNQLDTLHKQLEDLNLQYTALETTIALTVDAVAPLHEVDDALNDTVDRIQKMTAQRTTIMTAISRIQKAQAALKSGFVPKLNQSIQSYLNQLTKGRYDTIYIQDDLSFIVHVSRFMLDREPHFFSTGTRALIYFAMRLGLLDAIDQRHQPLLLDDTFIAFDDARLARVLALLDAEASTRQVILWTCQHREHTWLTLNNIVHHHLKLTD